MGILMIFIFCLSLRGEFPRFMIFTLNFLLIQFLMCAIL